MELELWKIIQNVGSHTGQIFKKLFFHFSYILYKIYNEAVLVQDFSDDYSKKYLITNAIRYSELDEKNYQYSTEIKVSFLLFFFELILYYYLN